MKQIIHIFGIPGTGKSVLADLIIAGLGNGLTGVEVHHFDRLHHYQEILEDEGRRYDFLIFTGHTKPPPAEMLKTGDWVISMARVP